MQRTSGEVALYWREDEDTKAQDNNEEKQKKQGINILPQMD